MDVIIINLMLDAFIVRHCFSENKAFRNAFPNDIKSESISFHFHFI